MENNPAPTPTNTTPPVAPSTPTSTQGTAAPSVVASPKKPGMNKKPLIMVLALLVIVVVLGALGYYYYANMMNKSSDEMSAVPSLEPVVSSAPTESPDQIKDGSELDGVVNDLDNATDEANMTKEVNGLQSDSNF